MIAVEAGELIRPYNRGNGCWLRRPHAIAYSLAGKMAGAIRADRLDASGEFQHYLESRSFAAQFVYG
jgi:hypothetical protein